MGSDPKILPSWVRCGTFTDLEGGTGLTVFYFPSRARGEAVISGYAPGTRHFDRLLHPFLNKRVDALLFSGGSVFGFAASEGVVRWLRERNQGEEIRGIRVPIVCQAVLFDLLLIQAAPLTEEAGYKAMNALKETVPVGCSGAGCGATVGKLLGMERATKSGAGYAASLNPYCGVYVVLNAFGEVLDPSTGRILAGVRGERRGSFQRITAGNLAGITPSPGENTTLIAAFLEGNWRNEELRYLAHSLLIALSRAVHPCGSLADGDLAAVFCSGEGEAGEPFSTALLLESLLFSALENALDSATTLGGVPSRKEWCDARGRSPRSPL